MHPPATPLRERGITAAWRDLCEVMGISAPVIVAMASHTVMGLIDTLMLSKYGARELAAVSPAGSAVFAFLAFIMGTGNCASTFVAQSMGRGEPEECARYTWQAIYFGLFAQAVVLPLIAGAPLLFAAFGHAPEVQRLESSYFRIVLAHAAATGAYAALASFFQGISRPGVPMWAALVANGFNVLADYALIFGKLGCPELGIRGAALATTLASYLQAGLLLAAFLWAPVHEQFRSRHHWRLDRARLRAFLHVGSAAGLSFMLDVASWAIFVNLLIGRLGEHVMAANSVTGSIMSLSFMPAVGINKGVQVLVGQYIGRRDIHGAKRRAYLGIGVAVAYMTAMGVLFFVFRREIFLLFRREEAIVEAGSTMLVLAAIFQAFDAVGIVVTGALRGAGDTRVPALITIASGWGVLIPLGYALTFPAGLGYVGAWSAAAVQIALVGLVLLWRFASEAWRKIDIFQGAGSPAVAQPDEGVGDSPDLNAQGR
ncbi:MAG TPA: MATE family efflux transporter [Planctomycetota bacterium]|nr:MATE family efflux transporter [Planctomycetota bacterium]HRR80605.1 MATE family efflux transporter [Planctomycetota bacterium]HRT95330.1 MATE family efflux transporter [Planctomycetota bacterium]